MDLLLIILLIAIVVIMVGIEIVSSAIKKGEFAKDATARATETPVALDPNVKRPYAIMDYDPEWPVKAELIKSVLAGIFKEKALSIEHVGSTSIPGMKAKPIIDTLIVVHRMERFDTEKRLMEALGYKWGDNYIAPGTIVFYKETADGGKSENVHVCELDSPKAKQFIIMRDYFRTHPEQALEYSDLKVALKQEHPNDYPAYRLGKKAFLDEAEQWAHEWHKN